MKQKTISSTEYQKKYNNLSEHEIQKKYFEILKLNEIEYPFLKYIFACPNGGHRHIAVARKLKAEGVKRGVPDIMIPIQKWAVDQAGFNGLFMEVKTNKGVLSKYQKEYTGFLAGQNYLCVLCRSVEELIKETEFYLNIKLILN